MATRNIQTPSLKDLLFTAQGFDEGVFTEIERLLKTKESVEPSDSVLQEIGERYEVDLFDLRSFIGFVTHLYRLLDGLEKEDLRPTLEGFLEKNEIKDEDGSFTTKLEKLLDYRSEHEKAAKLDRLTKGFIPFLMATSSFVDLRADFSRKKNGDLTGEINSFVSVAQVALFTDAMNDEGRQFIFQLDRKSTEKLIKSLEEVLAKMDALDNRRAP